MSGQEWLSVSRSCKILSKDSTNPGCVCGKWGLWLKTLTAIGSALSYVDTQYPLSGGHQDVELNWGKVWSLGQALTERSEPLA